MAVADVEVRAAGQDAEGDRQLSASADGRRQVPSCPTARDRLEVAADQVQQMIKRLA